MNPADALLPAWVQVIGAGALGISLSLNVGLMLRDSQLSKLKEWMTEALRVQRHDLRNELLIPTFNVANLHADFREHIALAHKPLVGKLPRPLLEPDPK